MAQTKREEDESLRDQVGRMISEHLAEGIDICNANDIDVIANEVVTIVLDTAVAAVKAMAFPSDEMFLVNAVDAIEELKP